MIIMNKGLQIVLLGLLFLVSGAVGYILEDILLGKEDTSEVVVEQPVAEQEVQEPAVSTIPVIPADGIKGPERNAAGNFDLSVLASVESAHQLKYFLYKDEACTQEAASNLSGTFADIPAVASKTYYVRVQNLATGDVSEVLPVAGFVELFKYKQITKAELEKLFNVDQDWGAASDDFRVRVSSSLSIKVNGLKEGERGVAKCDDICMKVFNGIWSSVVVENIGYDAQNRMNKLVIKVNY